MSENDKKVFLFNSVFTVLSPDSIIFGSVRPGQDVKVRVRNLTDTLVRFVAISLWSNNLGSQILGMVV